MRPTKNFLRKIDLFGVYYNFKYKSKERYQTSLGGLFILLFIILVCVMGIYYFIPFMNRKNYTIVYYTMNLAATEAVSLFAFESNLAVGLDCENNKNENQIITDLLDLKGKFITYVKSRDSSYKKYATDLNLHKCTYDDFYNKYDKQMDYLGVQRCDCLENKDNNIQGIYDDEVFTYYEFSVVAKNNSKELTEEIIRFLFENDCKFRFIYTDIIIDLDNYKNPEAQYLNEIFIQLNPTLFIKRNVYFMNQHFSNDDYLMFVFSDEDPTEVKPLYSRYEEYVLYKGMNRFVEHPFDYEYYSKLYLRADLKRTVIKRKYQKFMEFWADASSLLIAIYEIVCVIINYINHFYAYHSLSKFIFFFKDLDEENSFNIFKKRQKIQELLYISDLNASNNNSIEFDSKDFKDSKTNQIFSSNNKDSARINILENNKEEYQKEIRIYNNIKHQSKNKNIKSDKKNIEFLGNKLDIERTKINKIINSKNKNNGNTCKNFHKYDFNEIENDNYAKQYMNNKKRTSMINFNKIIKEDDSSESKGTKTDDLSSESSHNKKVIRANNSFNIFEIIITEFLKCCRSQEMIIKSEANEKANNILFKKMDIITYVRNMILFDLLNRIILDDSKKTIMNFICRPVISINDNNQKNEFDLFYRKYRERDFKKFYQEIQNLSKKQNKEEKDNKLVSYSNAHLKIFE